MESRRIQRLMLSPLISYLLSVSLIIMSTFYTEGRWIYGRERKA